MLQNLRGGPKGSSYSTSETSYHRIGYVHQAGRAGKGPQGQGRSISRGEWWEQGAAGGEA